jgi:hypothetical protein
MKNTMSDIHLPVKKQQNIGDFSTKNLRNQSKHKEKTHKNHRVNIVKLFTLTFRGREGYNANKIETYVRKMRNKVFCLQNRRRNNG